MEQPMFVLLHHDAIYVLRVKVALPTELTRRGYLSLTRPATPNGVYGQAYCCHACSAGFPLLRSYLSHTGWCVSKYKNSPTLMNQDGEAAII